MNTALKNQILQDLASLIREEATTIIKQNQKDLSACQDIEPSMLERLRIDHAKISGMIASIEQVKGFDDPEAQVLYSFEHENGLKVLNKSVSFGKVLIIYESRPDVTIEATIIAFKAGNQVVLKGGKEAKHTNNFLVELWHRALIKNQVNENHIQYLDLNREQMQELIKNNTYQVDLIIPRGGDGLISFVTQNTTIPILVSGRGNNFLYVDHQANSQMAIDIILNGKQRLSVCNALDKVIIHKNLANFKEHVLQLIEVLQENQIEIIGDDHICEVNPSVQKMQGVEILNEEFLSAKILLMTTQHIDDAIQVINKYSGGHSASIVTENQDTAEAFQNQVDCSAVFHNASTRFTDGSQFGMGSEIAISTQKLHFRGPIGVNQLVTNKWFISGTGQIRS